MSYKVNKQKCISCQVCVQTCPGAMRMGTDGKAEIINQEKLEQCGGESVCPMGAIEKIDGEPEPSKPQPQPRSQSQPSLGSYLSPGQGRGMGRGMGVGRGRGFGIGPRDGRGRGRDGGGRRR